MSSQGEGVKNFRFYIVKRQLRGGGGQKLPILRRHSLWTAPKIYENALWVSFDQLT